jgi:hypothetical protein
MKILRFTPLLVPLNCRLMVQRCSGTTAGLGYLELLELPMQILLQLASVRTTKYLYIEHHSVCPLVGIGTPPDLLPVASVPSPPDQRVGGTLASG